MLFSLYFDERNDDYKFKMRSALIKRIATWVVFLLAIHIAISFSFIFFPSWARFNGVTKAYKRYLIPGPFFSESRIWKTDNLVMSWKIDGVWSLPINPTLNNFTSYFNTLNPALLYQSSLERDIYEKALLQMDSSSHTIRDKQMEAFKFYFINKYAPNKVDSVKMTFIRKTTHNYKSKVDTLQIIVF